MVFLRPWPIVNRLPNRDLIVMLGDSLTAGVGASPGRTWPELLAEDLGKPVIAAGVSGDTTEGGLARLDRDVLSRKPGTVIVCLGGNDILQRVHIDDTMKNLDAIVTRAQASGAMVVLVGVQGIPFLSSHGSHYRALAKEKGAIFVPNILGGIIGNRRLMADQIHPNSDGYKLMAERAAKAIKPHLLP
jgi:lysophospholipase L1-like esterase